MDAVTVSGQQGASNRTTVRWLNIAGATNTTLSLAGRRYVVYVVSARFDDWTWQNPRVQETICCRRDMDLAVASLFHPRPSSTIAHGMAIRGLWPFSYSSIPSRAPSECHLIARRKSFCRVWAEFGFRGGATGRRCVVSRQLEEYSETGYIFLPFPDFDPDLCFLAPVRAFSATSFLPITKSLTNSLTAFSLSPNAHILHKCVSSPTDAHNRLRRVDVDVNGQQQRKCRRRRLTSNGLCFGPEIDRNDGIDAVVLRDRLSEVAGLRLKRNIRSLSVDRLRVPKKCPRGTVHENGAATQEMELYTYNVKLE
ncbi:hypothetical protein DFP72DRAFT_858503 [Ephemerocybe angulata]|uniref:Uncharacterized protein n=1 Tax=Ephemerocybe angulata TaxID=980116 RepID=A0A8H6HDB8_9AGAR|nr:hypothetical protein DFP72DRAFT_858503 [Tulosesus angulatus]